VKVPTQVLVHPGQPLSKEYGIKFATIGNSMGYTGELRGITWRTFGKAYGKI
jgi:hypothetical protein